MSDTETSGTDEMFPDAPEQSPTDVVVSTRARLGILALGPG